MSNVFTLDDLNAEIEKKYAPFIFKAGDQEFTLVSLLRVDKKVRKAVQDRLAELNDGKDENDTVSEDDTVATIEFVLSSVTQDNKGRALIRLLGGELVKLSTLMEVWKEQTQPGEA